MGKDTATIEKFIDPAQWMVWRFQVRVNLMAKELSGHIDGTKVKPEPAAASAEETEKEARVTEIAEWIKNDAQAQKIIVNSCGPKILIHLCNTTTAKQMWDKLHSVYEQTNQAAKHLLQEQFFAYKKDPKHDIATHISTLENLSEKLKAVNVNIDDSMLITKILMTLPSEYRHFSTAWDSTADNQRTLTNLTNRLLNEENRLGVQNVNLSQVGTSEALLMRQTPGTSKGANQNKKKKPKQKGKCFKCGSTEHWKKDCPAKSSDKSTDSSRHSTESKSFFGGAEKTTAKDDAWYLDSGSSYHMCKRRDWFQTFHTLETPIEVTLGNGEKIMATEGGELEILSYTGSNWIKKRMKKVLYSTKLYANLFSSTKAMDNGHTSWSDKDQYKLFDGDEIVAVGARRGSMFEMLIKVIEPNAEKSMLSVATKSNSLRVWHERLGHQNLAHVRKFLRDNDIDFRQEDFNCDGCAFGKLHRLSFDTREEKSTRCGEIIHSDVCGPMNEDSYGGAKYYVLFKDDYSHFRFIFFLKQKSEVVEKFKIVVNIAEKQFGHPVKILQSDNGREYINEEMKAFCNENGIHHRKSVAYTPEQNGCVERDNRTIMELARSMIHSKGLSKRLWAEAAHTAVYILNRTGTSTVKNASPFQLWYGRPAQFDHFRIFGSEVYVHIPKEKRSKLDAKARKCMFVGYDEFQKGFRVMDEHHRVTVARDVKFLTEEPTTVTFIDDDDDKKTGAVPKNNSENDQEENEPDIQQNVEQNIPDEIHQEPQPATESARGRGPGSRILHGMDRSNVLGSRLRNQDETAGMAMALLVFDEEPKSYKEAVMSDDSEKWLSAMEDEYNSLLENNTWILVEKPADQKVIDNKWIYKVKKNPGTSTERFKARLVGRGFTQEYGIDYLETFSPVVRFKSLRAILAIAACENMHMMQFDVKTAFLNGELVETVYMQQPIGFDDNSGRVCKLQRSLYGLKQASRCWNRKFTSFIEQFGFKVCDADPCVFVSHQNNDTLILAIYVDDGIVVGKSKEGVERVIAHLAQQFKITTMDVNCFLGFEIERRTDGSIFMHQTTYAMKILEKFRMNECNPVSVPSDPNQVLCKFDKSEESNFPYRQLVGSLLYLATATRPDISFAIGHVSRYMENPTIVHERALKRILKYIAGTVSHGITFQPSGNRQLIGYSDADYAGDVDTRKSTSGLAFFFNESIISWSSQLQQCVAQSTTEAEYVSASEATKELVSLRQLFDDLLPSQSSNKAQFYMDNKSAIRLVKNPEYHKRTKHIDVRYHFIRKKFEEGFFNLHYVPTEEMIADIFTKALPRERFELLRTSMGIKSK